HQPASGFAVVGVAARVAIDDKGAVSQVGVGITGVGPKAYRAAAVEAALREKSPSSKRLEEAAAHAADGIQANSDLYASGEYRAHHARVYTRRALEEAVERASGKYRSDQRRAPRRSPALGSASAHPGTAYGPCAAPAHRI